MAYEVLPFKSFVFQIKVQITQRTTCLLTKIYAVKTGQPRGAKIRYLGAESASLNIKYILNQYYIGSCTDLENRINNHLNKKYKNSFTTKAEDWEVFFAIEDLDLR